MLVGYLPAWERDPESVEPLKDDLGVAGCLIVAMAMVRAWIDIMEVCSLHTPASESVKFRGSCLPAWPNRRRGRGTVLGLSSVVVLLLVAVLFPPSLLWPVSDVACANERTDAVGLVFRFVCLPCLQPSF